MTAAAHCAICMPVARAIEPACEKSLRVLEYKGYPVYRLFGVSAVDQARNRVAATALANPQIEELFWIDSDMDFDPDDVEKLRDHNLPIVCGLYPVKGCSRLSANFLPETTEVIMGTKGGLMEIRYSAGGFLLTRRGVYTEIRHRQALPVCDRKLKQDHVPYFLPMIVDDGDGEHACLGEDYSFCHRARLSGYRIMADTSVRVRHVGGYSYSWEDLRPRAPETEFPIRLVRPGGSK